MLNTLSASGLEVVDPVSDCGVKPLVLAHHNSSSEITRVDWDEVLEVGRGFAERWGQVDSRPEFLMTMDYADSRFEAGLLGGGAPTMALPLCSSKRYVHHIGQAWDEAVNDHLMPRLFEVRAGQ